MDRIWLKSYPQGVPPEIDHHRYESLVQLLDETFKKYRDRTAYICMGKAITYGELDDMSNASAPGCSRKGCRRATASR